MPTVEMTLHIPAEWLRDAEDFGGFDEQMVLSLIRQDLDQRIMDFVNAEVHAYRAEQAAKKEPSD
jgi:hypothetical protein